MVSIFNRLAREADGRANSIFLDTLKLLVLHEGFQVDVDEMRTRFDVLEQGATGEEIAFWEARLHDEGKGQGWQNAIQTLLDKYALTQNMKEVVKNYIVHHDLGLGVSPISSYQIEYDPDKSGEITVKVTGPVSNAQQRQIFRTLLSIQSDRRAIRGLPKWKTYKPYRNIDRDIEFAKLEKLKKSSDDPAIVTDTDIAARLFENEGWESMKNVGEIDRRNAALIRKARERLKKMLRARFPRDTFTAR